MLMEIILEGENFFFNSTRVPDEKEWGIQFPKEGIPEFRISDDLFIICDAEKNSLLKDAKYVKYSWGESSIQLTNYFE
jgi:hypothetical protein